MSWRRAERAPTVWTEGPDAMLEHLWTQTQTTTAQIAHEVSRRFGLTVTSDQVRDRAHIVGLVRPQFENSRQLAAAAFERRQTRSLDNWRRVQNEPDRVAPVEPGTHKAERFSMLGGRL